MKQENFLKGLLKFGIGPLGAAFISFITIPIITWMVPPEEFGKTVIFTLIQGFFTMFLYLGLDQAYIRDYSSKKNKEAFFNNMLFPSIVLGIILSFILFLFSERISELLGLDNLIIFFLALWIPAIIFERFFLLDIRLKENGLVYSLFNVLNKFFILIFTLILLMFWEKSYQSVIIASVIGQMICTIILLVYSSRHIKFKISYFDRKQIVSSFKFGLPFIPALLIWWGFSSLDRVFLSMYTNFEDLGIYVAALKVIGVLAMFQTIFSSYWVPVAHRWFNEKVEVKEYMKISHIVFFFMSIIFMLVLFLKAEIFYILSPEYSSASNILPFLLFYPIMYTVSDTTVLGISFSKKSHYNIWISIIALAVCIISNILLIPKFGVIGAAIANGITYITFFWTRTLISRKLWFAFDLRYYVIQTLLLLLAAIVNTAFDNVYVYFYNLIILLVIIVFNRRIIIEGIDLIKKLKLNKNIEKKKSMLG